MNSMINDDTQLFRKFADDEGFKRWLTDAVFDLTYKVAACIRIKDNPHRVIRGARPTIIGE